MAVSQTVIAATSALGLSGVNAALVTRRGNLEPAASSYFWLAVVTGLIGSATFFGLAGPVTSLLDQPQAAPYVAVLGMTFPLTLMRLVPNAVLQRRLRFGWLNSSVFGSSLAYFLVEIVLALMGFGAWAVIIGQVVEACSSLAISALGARWLPRISFRWSAVRSDLRMTSGLGAAQILGYVQKNSDYWSCSAFLGPAPLGIYYVAYVLPNIIRLRLTSVVRQVMLPAYATADRKSEVRALWERTMPVTLGLGLPLLVGVALLAGPLVRVFFGTQWVAAVTPMRILTLTAVADLFLASLETVTISQRRVARHLQVLAMRAALTAGAAVGAAIVWGSITAVASAVSVSALLTLVVYEVRVSRPLGAGLGEICRNNFGYAGALLVMTTVVVVERRLVGESLHPTFDLLVAATVGVVSYGGAAWLFARSSLQLAVADSRRILVGR